MKASPAKPPSAMNCRSLTFDEPEDSGAFIAPMQNPADDKCDCRKARTISQTKSRTCTNYWLQPLMPENGIVISTHDAAELGLDHGDEVKIVSATNPQGVWDLGNGRKKEMLGKVIVTEAIRPGVVSFALGFGNWATGSADVTIDGKTIVGDPRRGRGIHANAAMWTDPALKNTCMFDPVGGSVSFYDSHIRLEKTGRKATHAEQVALRAL